MSLTTEQKHAKMDEAYNDFMADFTEYLQDEILRLGGEYGMPPTVVLTITGRGLLELGAMDLICGLGGAPVTEHEGAVKEFSNNILGCTMLAARATLKRLEIEIQ